MVHNVESILDARIFLQELMHLSVCLNRDVTPIFSQGRHHRSGGVKPQITFRRIL